MRAIVLREHGGPEVLHREEVPVPVPGRHQLLVAVRGTSVNPVDTRVRRGGGASRSMPIILGYDASGVVRACGPDVRGWAEGDVVFGCPNLFGPGANADYVVLDARAAAKKPATVDHATAACLPLVSLTAWESLHERARIQAGQTILIHAGAGGVGHVAVQLARLHGCRVITTAGRPESIAFCRDVLRCDEVIDYARTDFVARVRDLTGGRGVDVVLDTVGDETFRRSIDCVAPRGQIVTILASLPGDKAPLLLYRSITVHYEFMGVPVANDVAPERQGAILDSIGRLVDGGLLRPHLSARLPLERVADAHRQIETGRTIGKIAIEVARTDRASIEVPVAPEAVFAAFADPAKLMTWLPPNGMTGRALEYEFRPGGRYGIALTFDPSMRGAVGKTTDRTDISKGRFLSIEAGRRIVQSVEFESTDTAFAGEMIMTWSFEPTATGALVTITAENVPPGISQADHDTGLRSSLENVARFCIK